MVIELTQRDRCVTIGESTSGGAGGKLSFSLPAGGEFNMSTFRATYPDGRDYMNNGISPDIKIENFFKDENPRILLVDDNGVNRQVASEILRKSGCLVDNAEDGRQAIEAVQQKEYVHHMDSKNEKLN